MKWIIISLLVSQAVFAEKVKFSIESKGVEVTVLPKPHERSRDVQRQIDVFDNLGNICKSNARTTLAILTAIDENSIPKIEKILKEIRSVEPDFMLSVSMKETSVIDPNRNGETYLATNGNRYKYILLICSLELLNFPMDSSKDSSNEGLAHFKLEANEPRALIANKLMKLLESYKEIMDMERTLKSIDRKDESRGKTGKTGKS